MIGVSPHARTIPVNLMVDVLTERLLLLGSDVAVIWSDGNREGIM